jgi:hypothetical protein
VQHLFNEILSSYGSSACAKLFIIFFWGGEIR